MIVKTKVNPETTKDLNDDQLESLIYSKAVDLYLKTFGETFTNTNNGILLYEVFSTFVVDDEVRNGGFDQYFVNNAGLVPISINGLKKIGANDHAELLIKADVIFKEQIETFGKERNPNLDPLDEAFYELEDFSLLRQRFIREHMVKFFD